MQILGNDPESWSDLFTSFRAALDGRALSSLDRIQTSAAFLNSLLECMVFLVKRMTTAQKQADEPVSYEGAITFVKDQMSRVWTELSTRKLRVDETEAGKALARTFSSFEAIQTGMSNYVEIVLRRSYNAERSGRRCVEADRQLHHQ